MKFCHNCGSALPSKTASFCPECGESVKVLVDVHPADFSDSDLDIMSEKSSLGAHHRKTQSVTGSCSHPPLPTQKKGQRMKPSIHHGTMTRNKWHSVENKTPTKPKNSANNPVDLSSCAVNRQNLMDINYDGYYNDVPTGDNGRSKEGLDPELIKRIAIVAGSVVVIVILSIIIMTVM